MKTHSIIVIYIYLQNSFEKATCPPPTTDHTNAENGYTYYEGNGGNGRYATVRDDCDGDDRMMVTAQTQSVMSWLMTTIESDAMLGLRLDPYKANLRWYGTGDAYAFNKWHLKNSNYPDQECIKLKNSADYIEPISCTGNGGPICQTKRADLNCTADFPLCPGITYETWTVGGSSSCITSPDFTHTGVWSIADCRALCVQEHSFICRAMTFSDSAKTCKIADTAGHSGSCGSDVHEERVAKRRDVSCFTFWDGGSDSWTYSAAETECAAHANNGILATITSDDDYDEVKSTIAPADKDAWIGLKYEDIGGGKGQQLVWRDGILPEYSQIITVRTDLETKNCIYQHKASTKDWRSKECDHTYNYVCEAPTAATKAKCDSAPDVTGASKVVTRDRGYVLYTCNSGLTFKDRSRAKRIYCPCGSSWADYLAELGGCSQEGSDSVAAVPPTTAPPTTVTPTTMPPTTVTPTTGPPTTAPPTTVTPTTMPPTTVTPTTVPPTTAPPSTVTPTTMPPTTVTPTTAPPTTVTPTTMPPTTVPPTTVPPTTAPPSTVTPTTMPPTTVPPTTASPTNALPTNMPPTTVPPTTVPPTTIPPITALPTNMPPTTVPPTTAPPTTVPPTNMPSTNMPPNTMPSTTVPPTTVTPTTVTPNTLPPTTVSPTIAPPTTAPPTTLPPTTMPPTTVPPTIVPPTITQTPTTHPPSAQSPSTQQQTILLSTNETPTTQLPSTQVPSDGAPTAVTIVTHPSTNQPESDQTPISEVSAAKPQTTRSAPIVSSTALDTRTTTGRSTVTDTTSGSAASVHRTTISVTHPPPVTVNEELSPVVVNCGPPPEAPNTVQVKFGNVVTYDCEKDSYMMDGGRKRSILCLTSGNWSLTNVAYLRCQVPTCASPAVDLKVARHYGINDVHTSTCTSDRKYGYGLPWINTMCVLLRQGVTSQPRWSQEIPSCEDNHCPPPPYLKHLHLKPVPGWGAVVATCKPGYRYLDGSNSKTVYCNNESWGEWELCHSLHCPEIVPPLHGNLDANTTGVGALVTISCDEGFMFEDGNVTVTTSCSTDGLWDILDANKTCTVITCSAIPDVTNSVRSSLMTSPPHRHKTTVSYTCNAAHRTETGHTETEVFCGAPGKWIGYPFTCKIGRCPPVPEVAHATTDTILVEPGTIVTYTCHTGYNIQERNTRIQKITCTDGVWTNIKDTCSEIHCDTIEPGAGLVNTSNTIYQTVAAITCQSGYHINGSSDVNTTCEGQGEWSTDTTCEKVDCASPPDIIDGFKQTEQNTLFGSNVTYYCLKGLWFPAKIFSVTLHCGPDKHWENHGGYKLICEELRCPPLPAWEGLEISSLERHYLASVNTTCPEGTTFRGLRNTSHLYTTCQEDATWFPQIPECKSNTPRNTSVPVTESDNAELIGTIMTAVSIACVLVVAVSDIPTVVTAWRSVHSGR